MADVKITALTAISSNPVNPATFPIPMVDLLDNAITASGTTKKVTVNQILGAGGTATLASATITGAATVGTTLGVTGVSTFAAGTALLPALTTTGDTNTGIYYPAADTFAVTTGGTERLRVDSTGLGVGVSPSYNIHARGATDGRLQVEGASGFGMVFIQGSSGNSAQLQLNSSGGSGRRFALSSGSSGQFSIADETAALARLAIDSSGNVTVSTGNLVMGTANKGIDFSAVTGGTGTATGNVLNDYEEGTFVPTLSGGTTQPATLITGTGRYTKVGRVVTVQIYFNNVSTVGYSGLIGITGLPFTNNASVGSTGIPSFYNIATFTGSPVVALGVNESFLNCYSSISNSAFGNVTHNAGASGNYLTTSITYTVA